LRRLPLYLPKGTYSITELGCESKIHANTRMQALSSGRDLEQSQQEVLKLLADGPRCMIVQVFDKRSTGENAHHCLVQEKGSSWFSTEISFNKASYTAAIIDINRAKSETMCHYALPCPYTKCHVPFRPYAKDSCILSEHSLHGASTPGAPLHVHDQAVMP